MSLETSLKLQRYVSSRLRTTISSSSTAPRAASMALPLRTTISSSSHCHLWEQNTVLYCIGSHVSVLSDYKKTGPSNSLGKHSHQSFMSNWQFLPNIHTPTGAPGMSPPTYLHTFESTSYRNIPLPKLQYFEVPTSLVDYIYFLAIKITEIM